MQFQKSTPVPATLNLSPETWRKITDCKSRSRINQCILSRDGFPSIDRDEVLGSLTKARILVCSWGSCPLSTYELSQCENLELIIYAAGSLRGAFPELTFPESVTVSTAAHLNARPVAEYTLGLILSSLRGAFTWTERLRANGLTQWWELHHRHANGYANRCIAIVGFGLIARKLIDLLRPFGFRILVVSDFARHEDELRLGFTKATLFEAAEQADVLTLHEANLPQFHHMIDSTVLNSMKDRSTLINTARGSLIDEIALYDTLANRPLLALLDVIEQENTSDDSHPLLHLPNCFLTPHVAGSLQGEVKRFGAYIADEIENFLRGEPLEGKVDLDSIAARA